MSTHWCCALFRSLCFCPHMVEEAAVAVVESSGPAPPPPECICHATENSISVSATHPSTSIFAFAISWDRRRPPTDPHRSSSLTLDVGADPPHYSPAANPSVAVHTHTFPFLWPDEVYCVIVCALGVGLELSADVTPRKLDEAAYHQLLGSAGSSYPLSRTKAP